MARAPLPIPATEEKRSDCAARRGGQEPRFETLGESRGVIQKRDAHSLRHAAALYGSDGLSGWCAAGLSVLTRRIWPLDPNQSLVNTIG